MQREGDEHDRREDTSRRDGIARRGQVPTGATLAAATGATTKELMRRMGHSSPAAALIYQHAADNRDGEIARALDAMLSAAPVVPIEVAPSAPAHADLPGG